VYGVIGADYLTGSWSSDPCLEDDQRYSDPSETSSSASTSTAMRQVGLLLFSI
jgi:hypothetical protein